MVILDQAEQHLRNKDFDRVLELLEQVDQSSLAGIDVGVYCLLMTEISIHLGQYRTDLIDSAIECFRFEADSRLFARAKLMKGWLLICLGKPHDAKEVLLESYVSFLRCNDKAEASVVLNRLAQVYSQVGEVDLAISNLERCIALEGESVSIVEGDKKEFSRINMAYLMFTAGRIQDASREYDHLTTVLEPGTGRNSVVCWFMSALPKAALGEYASALANLQLAEAAASEYRREQVIIEENYGYVLLTAKRSDEAQDHLVRGLRLALEIAPDSALVSQIKRLLADCFIAGAKFKKAEKYAREALSVAEKIGQRVEIAACYRVFAQVAAQDGKADEARRQFKAAVELFNQISSRYELAITRYLAASSGLFEQGESLALLYLAKEYCEAEQVAPYLSKIDAALAKMEPHKITLQPSSGSDTAKIITRNKRMLSLLDLARHVAPTNMTVLLTGETGTGKDLLARYIHEQSGCTGQFVSQNVTTLPATMFEAELFGYKKGAYTGAVDERNGLIKYAERGTLFLNEIGEASTELQTKLLEVLETRRIRRIGENQDQPVEFRLIAATNADLAECVRSGKFRADLYHRLNQATITLPPLRDRIDDIAPLARHFLASLGDNNGDESAMSELMTILSSYTWPGNVRELEHTIRRLWVMYSGSVTRMSQAVSEDLAHIEDTRLMAVIAECGGNKSKAARILGVSEGTIRYRLKQGN